jgi:phosphomannomutase
VFASVDKLGAYTVDNSYLHKHIQAILDYPLIDLPAIRSKHFKVVVDTINSTGALFIPPLLKSLGIENIRMLNEEVNGRFAHNPDPSENLAVLSAEVKKSGADLGYCGSGCGQALLRCEDGTMFGEEFTLVAVADYILSQNQEYSK